MNDGPAPAEQQAGLVAGRAITLVQPGQRSYAHTAAPPPSMFVRASAPTAGEQYDSYGQFMEQAELRGRLPTYREVAMGLAIEVTGEAKASHDGKMVMQQRYVAARQAPAAVSAENFAPKWWGLMQKAARERDNKEMRDMRRVAVEPGHGFQ